MKWDLNSRKKHVLPVNIIIGIHKLLLQLDWYGSSSKILVKVAVASIGDGGTAHGDFNEALTLLGHLMHLNCYCSK